LKQKQFYSFESLWKVLWAELTFEPPWIAPVPA
jgi:hypothetical protein